MIGPGAALLMLNTLKINDTTNLTYVGRWAHYLYRSINKTYVGHKAQQLSEQKDLLLTSSVKTLHLSVSNFVLACLAFCQVIYPYISASTPSLFSYLPPPVPIPLSSYLAPSLCLPNSLSLHPSCPLWICPSVLSCLSVCLFVFSLSFRCLWSSESDLKLNSCLWKKVENCCCGRLGKLSSCFTSG